jgi:hypothetical protein
MTLREQLAKVSVKKAAVLLVLYQLLALAACGPALSSGIRDAFLAPSDKHLGHDWSSAGSGDGKLDWAAARLFLDHKSPYTHDGLVYLGAVRSGYGHPPTTPFWFIPVAHLDPVVMAQVVAAAALLVLLAHVFLCVTELAVPSPLVTTALVFSFIAGSSWMVEHLHVIQISEFIAFAYVLAWYCLRRGDDVRAGVCIGLSCTFKLFPGVMVLYFMLTRRWRAVVAAGASYLAVAAIMTWRYGLASWPEFFKQQSDIAKTWMGHVRNASLQGIVMRALKPLCEGHADPRRLTTAIAGGVSVLLLGGAWLLVRRRLRAHEDEDLTFSLFATISVFINAWVWEHYRVFLILPGLLIARAAWLRVRDAWCAWARETTPTIDLRGMPWRATVMALVMVAGLAVIAVCLRDHMWHKVQAVDTYTLGRMPAAHRSWLHVRMHRLEIENWLPWPLAIGLLMVALSPAAGRTGSRRPS